jgi:drug/metabolite transporter (DMT)-like permease
MNGKTESGMAIRQQGLAITPRLSGALFVVLSAIGFGALGIFGKAAFAAGASTVTVLFLRFLVAGMLMAVLMSMLRLPWPRGRHFWILAGMGAVGYVGQAFCYFSALRHATAGLTALLLYLYPSLVTLAAAALGRQRLTLLKAALAVASLFGILLTVADGLAGTPTGIAFGAGAAVIYTAYILVGERVTPRTGAIPAGTVVMLASATVFGVATAVEGAHWPVGAAGWLAVAAIALVATVIPIIGFFAGMQRLGAADTATISTLEPVVTLILAYLILDEKLGLIQALGAGLVIAAVVALTRVGRAR